MYEPYVVDELEAWYIGISACPGGLMEAVRIRFEMCLYVLVYSYGMFTNDSILGTFDH